MTLRPRPLAWAPAFFAGAAAATAAEISVGLLLYAGPGLVRSLTTVLAVEAAALSLGLWTAPDPRRPDLLESVRRRWLLCLGVFLLATLYSAFWSVLEPVGGGALGQGLGLAFMAGLPLYACGTLLGGMNAVSAADLERRVRSVGGAAFAGAVVGFAVTGVALPRVLAPASLYLGCLVLLSGGGLMWGGALDRRLRMQLKSTVRSDFGEVRVEDRRLPSVGTVGRALFEGSHVRRWISGAEPPLVPWEVVLFNGWAGPDADKAQGQDHGETALGAQGGEEPGTQALAEGTNRRVLLVGGGASALPDAAIRGFSDVEVDLFERNPTVLESAREYMETGLSGESERLHVLTGNLEDHLLDATDRYDLVVVDVQGMGAIGGIGGMSRAGYEALLRSLRREGVFCVGPRAPGRALPDRWIGRVLNRPVPACPSELDLAWPEEEEVLVASPSGDLPWLLRIDGFSLQDEALSTVPAHPPIGS